MNKSIKKQVEDVLNAKPESWIPNPEEGINRIKKAILLLAEEIDTLNGYELKRDE